MKSHTDTKDDERTGGCFRTLSYIPKPEELPLSVRSAEVKKVKNERNITRKEYFLKSLILFTSLPFLLNSPKYDLIDLYRHLASNVIGFYDLLMVYSLLESRSIDTCTILLLGETGGGKSTTINTLFDDENLCPTSNTISQTSDTSEFMTVMNIEGYAYKLNVIDTPGFCDTRDPNDDYVHAENILYHLNSSGRSHKAAVNIILLTFKFCNRMDGVESNISKTLRKIKDYFENWIDLGVGNVYCVITHANQMAPNMDCDAFRDMKRLMTDVIESHLFRIFGPNNIPVIFLDNRRVEGDGGLSWRKLPDGTECPKNLFEVIQSRSSDYLAKYIIAHYFSNENKKNASKPMRRRTTTHIPEKKGDIIFRAKNRLVPFSISEKDDIKSLLTSAGLLSYYEYFENEGFTNLQDVKSFITFEDFIKDVNIPIPKAGDRLKMKRIFGFEGPTNEINCLETVPFYDALQFGFNVYTVQICTNPIFSNRSDARSTITLDGKNYKVPTSIRIFREESSIQELCTSASTSRWSRSLAAKMGVTFSYAEFALDPTLAFNIGRSLSAEESVAIILCEFAKYRVKMLDKEVCEGFKAALCQLPKDPESPQFDQFFNMWGTHYICEAKFGGTLKFIKTENTQRSESGIDSKLALVAFKVIEGSLSFNDISQLDEKNSNITMIIEGGDIENTQIDTWKNSLQQRPVLIKQSIRLVSIIELVPTEQKEVISKALSHYAKKFEVSQMALKEEEQKNAAKLKLLTGDREQVSTEAKDQIKTEVTKKSFCIIL